MNHRVCLAYVVLCIVFIFLLFWGVDKEITIAIINAFSTIVVAFAWPAAVLFTVFTFREELRRLITRVKSVKYPGGEITTQEEDPEPLKPTNTTKEKVELLELIDPKGFWSREGVQKLVGSSGLDEIKDERVHGSLLLFSTSRQRTWLIATTVNLYCVLDDEKTREKGSLIQWKVPLRAIDVVDAHFSPKGNPVVNIGPKKSWLYSSRLHKNAAILQHDIKELVKKARESA